MLLGLGCVVVILPAWPSSGSKGVLTVPFRRKCKSGFVSECSLRLLLFQALPFWRLAWPVALSHMRLSLGCGSGKLANLEHCRLDGNIDGTIPTEM
jgi:hypothetical protein